MNVLYGLLILVPVALLSRYLGGPAVLTFGAAALGIVPLAALLGRATEALAERAGPRVSGLINGTLGNAAELIITFFAIRAGLLELVKASITGSILGNLLLVMGLSLLVGGLRHGLQKFDRTQAGLNATMLMLAVIALGIPSLFSHAIEVGTGHMAVEYLSLGVAGAMLLVYVLSQFYLLRNGGGDSRPDVLHSRAPSGMSAWPLWKTLGGLALSTALIAWLSEVLVAAVEPVLEHLGWTEFFIGVVIIPLVGNTTEHLVAVQVAAKDEMDLSMGIAVGSGLQVALFVAPVLVFLSLAMGNPLTLVFNTFELAALGAASIIAALVSQDGESNWMEGVQLLVVYLILALAFYFLPTGG
ncbi:MAG: calcium/proton exchanger [Thermoflexales bacterium]|nr:calcium/proton exchanger [Thermoflexales bacterium]